MIKVKMMYSNNLKSFERDINEFLNSKKNAELIDTKLSIHEKYIVCMVIYKEKEGE